MAELRDNVTFTQPRFIWRLALVDFLAWTIAVPLSVILRFDFAPPTKYTVGAIAGGLTAGLLYVVLASTLRM